MSGQAGQVEEARIAATLAVLHEIDSAPPSAEGSRLVLETVATMLQADQGVLLLRNPLTGALDCILYNHDPALCRSFAEYYWRLAPTRIGACIAAGGPHWPRPPGRMVFDLRELVDYGQLVSTEYYNDFFRPAGIHHDLLTYVSGTRGARGALFLFRSRHARPFSSQEAATLELLAPFVCNHSQRMVDADLLAVAEKVESRGIVICDCDGRVLYWNDSALDLCALLSAFVRGGWLQGGHGGDSPQDRLATGSRLAESGAQIGFARCAAAAGTDDVHVRVREVHIGDGVGGRVIILESGGGSTARLKEVLGNRFGLSERQIEVLGGVMEGATNSEIARRLFISERTVKWHLQNVADKVGARTRTAIVRAVHDELGRQE